MDTFDEVQITFLDTLLIRRDAAYLSIHVRTKLKLTLLTS